MRTLKSENLRKCLSLLREFIDEAPQTDKKGIAALALNQLQAITAGIGPGDSPINSNCNGRPRIDGSSFAGKG